MLIIEKQGYLTDGHKFLIGVNSVTASRNGYIGIDTNSVLFGVDYTKYKPLYDVQVHGGITFAGYIGENILGLKKYYYFGFDCSHYGDGSIDVAEYTKIVLSTELSDQEKVRLLNDYKLHQDLFSSIKSQCHAKSYDFVFDECSSLSLQLHRIELENSKNIKKLDNDIKSITRVFNL